MTRVQITTKDHSSQYAHEAALYILGGLQSFGLNVQSVAEAIERGYITDLQWCATLEDFRVRARATREGRAA